LILIPQFGIVGAAMASLISYSALAVMMVVVACRLSNLSPLTIVVPGKAEVRLLWSAAGRAVASLRARLAGRGRGAAANGAAGGIDSGTPS
jgi:Na+-driven multidrug efflux pump